jgi:hypothetical protein
MRSIPIVGTGHFLPRRVALGGKNRSGAWTSISLTLAKSPRRETEFLTRAAMAASQRRTRALWLITAVYARYWLFERAPIAPLLKGRCVPSSAIRNILRHALSGYVCKRDQTEYPKHMHCKSEQYFALAYLDRGRCPGTGGLSSSRLDVLHTPAPKWELNRSLFHLRTFG